MSVGAAPKSGWLLAPMNSSTTIFAAYLKKLSTDWTDSSHETFRAPSLRAISSCCVVSTNQVPETAARAEKRESLKTDP
ncbi:Uncharacterised protein [Actinomyces bovis]|uniref:Uncharacterized protein n=1 Tax=Actinomyces bovis TaxID=1658 RepID=A0ABY1VLE6_9ACTO|nr:Uncharacterised protein [Actinomyces bovis]VEG54712.1 Uncharacterised protein [Actinomyces israelii]